MTNREYKRIVKLIKGLQQHSLLMGPLGGVGSLRAVDVNQVINILQAFVDEDESSGG